MSFNKKAVQSIADLRDAIDESDYIRSMYTSDKIFHWFIEKWCESPPVNERKFVSTAGIMKTLGIQLEELSKEIYKLYKDK